MIAAENADRIQRRADCQTDGVKVEQQQPRLSKGTDFLGREEGDVCLIASANLNCFQASTKSRSSTIGSASFPL